MAYTQNDAYLMTACRRVTSGQFPEQVGTIKLPEDPDTGGGRLVGNDSPDCWLRPPAYTNQHQVSALISVPSNLVPANITATFTSLLEHGNMQQASHLVAKFFVIAVQDRTFQRIVKARRWLAPGLYFKSPR